MTHHQNEHERINAREYPGTRQLCECCEQPTERCEEDAFFSGDFGPLCEACYAIVLKHNQPDHRLANRPSMK